ncbi:hypothetical protein HYU94_01205 [Candidatus Daviesbacteria bacterium]|nr:hypothetical protein [Candidatus Daviesbacteria bacterium]
MSPEIKMYVPTPVEKVVRKDQPYSKTVGYKHYGNPRELEKVRLGALGFCKD